MKTRIILLIAIFVMTTGLSQQKATERKMQENLPIASGDLWQKLAKAKIDFDDKKNAFTATVPQDVKQLSGKTESIAGFMLPLESTMQHDHFLLSKRTPTCPYCMPGGPTEVIDVYMQKPVEYNNGLLFITGTFKLVDDTKSGLYFRLENATIQNNDNPIKPKSIISQPPV